MFSLRLCVSCVAEGPLHLFFGFHELVHLPEEPRIDVRQLVDFGESHPRFERALDLEDPFRCGLSERATQRFHRIVGKPVVTEKRANRPSWTSGLESAQSLLQRLLERAANRHRLADGFHHRRELRVRGGEFLEREPRTFHDHVVEHRLERSRCRPGDVVRDLVEAVAHSELGADARDRKPRCLRCQSRRPRHARIHLDHEHLAIGRIDRKLDVASACLDADLANDRDCRIAHLLIFAVGERHRRRNSDRVTGVNAHRIYVFDRADDHDVVRAVAHHLELELLPSDDAALDENLAHG